MTRDQTDAQKAETQLTPIPELDANKEIERLWQAVGVIKNCPQSLLDKLLDAYKRQSSSQVPDL